MSKQKLAAIDKDVHTLDPNWPIVAVDEDPPAATIFVNPDFVEVSFHKSVSQTDCPHFIKYAYIILIVRAW